MVEQEDDNLITDTRTAQPRSEMTVLPPDSGFLGRFLEETENMLKARAMRMSGLLRRINQSGQRTESLLREAAEQMEAAESRLEQQFRKQGLSTDAGGDSDVLIDP